MAGVPAVGDLALSRDDRSTGRVRYPPDRDFQPVLQRRVREQLALHPERENFGMLGQILIVGAWFYISCGVLIFASLPFWAVALGVASLGLAIAGLLMIVVHDALHHSISRRPWLNDGICWLTSAALGISADWWRAKHNGLHHPFTNVAGFDDDIDIGKIARVAPDQPWRPWHRFQHIYVFVLSPLMYLNMALIADPRFIATGRIGSRQVERPTVRRAVPRLAQKLGGVTVLLVVALTRQPAVSVVAVTIIAALVAGASLSIIFQLQHCVEETVFPELDAETTKVDRPWFVTQAEGAADFATGSRVLTWYSGALNFHIEHHLFPRVPHNRLPELRPIVRQTCAEFGVRQTELPTLRAAVRSHYRYLKRMGARPGTVVDIAHAERIELRSSL